MEVCVGRCHGGWSPSDGFVQVPRGTTVYLFLDSMRSMADVDADAAVLMTAEGLQGLQSKASQTITEFRTVNNYSTQALTEADTVIQGPLAQGVELVNDDGLHLSDIMEKYKGNNIYWFACQALVLDGIVDGVDLNKLDLDKLEQLDLDAFDGIDFDNEAGLSDEQRTLLQNLQELLRENDVSDLKELKARKQLVNQIQRF